MATSATSGRQPSRPRTFCPARSRCASSSTGNGVAATLTEGGPATDRPYLSVRRLTVRPALPAHNGAMDRAAGILLHPTSLPSRHGIGDLGPAAYRFVDWLAAEGMRIWQVLPLGPVGYGESPYQLFSAFAGNPHLISLEA